MSQKLAPFLHLLKEMVRTISQLARQQRYRSYRQLILMRYLVQMAVFS